MPFARYFCIFINVGLGEAAKRNVGNGKTKSLICLSGRLLVAMEIL